MALSGDFRLKPTFRIEQMAAFCAVQTKLVYSIWLEVRRVLGPLRVRGEGPLDKLSEYVVGCWAA
jgi:hypothetical protein